jgi:triacylglycerol lipase
MRLIQSSSPRRTVDRAPVAGTPVLLVHGLGGTPSGWLAVATALRARGTTVAAMSYRPFGRTVEQLAEQLADEVGRLRSETGAARVHLVGHSLGGVVIAQALAAGLLAGQVDTVMTLASPFGGSPWARLVPLAATLRSLREGSPLLRRLTEAPVPEDVRWIAVTATADLVVPGRRSVPNHARVETFSVSGVGHLGLLLHPKVVRMVVVLLPSTGASVTPVAAPVAEMAAA